MTPYNAPLQDMRFVLNHVVGLENVAQLPGFEGIDKDLTDQILEEASKFSSNILAPLNRIWFKFTMRQMFIHSYFCYVFW